MPTGAGIGAGPFHSQSNESWFFHVPGIKLVYPSNPYDAKGLLCSSIDDKNPVMYFEHKALYRSIKGEVPDSMYNIELGRDLSVFDKIIDTNDMDINQVCRTVINLINETLGIK